MSQQNQSPFDRYMEHLDGIFQVEPQFFALESETAGISGVVSIIYEDIPEKGMITAVTYGLSLVEHEDWKFGRPELMTTVSSKDFAWGQAIGFLANRLRGVCPFSYSNTINFREKIAPESEMNAFLIFAPSILNQERFSAIDIGADYQINLVGAYPIFSSEMDLVSEWGLEKFWHHPKFDMYNISRQRIEK